MDNILSRMAFCTFSTGSSMVREVLDDWEEFLGGRPAEVIFVVAATRGVVPPIYEDLLTEGRIDRLIRKESTGRSPESMNAEAVFEAVHVATAEWVAVVKLDTLPYRSGHDDWLAKAIHAIETGHHVGITSTAPFDRNLKQIDNYRLYQGYSENFAITRRSDWLEAVETTVGPGGYYGDAIQNNPSYQRDEHRLINEHALRDWMVARDRWMLIQVESQDWSIFHVNVWGERLRQVRKSYLARKGIGKFLNCMYPTGQNFLYPWNLYYGTEPPSLLVRLRIALGRWRRRVRANSRG